MHVHTCTHTFTCIGTISELRRNWPSGFKSLPWTSGCFASLQQMKGERGVVLHFRHKTTAEKAEEHFVTAWFCCMRMKMVWERTDSCIFCKNPSCKNSNNDTNRTDLWSFVGLEPKRHKIFSGKKIKIKQKRICALCNVLTILGHVGLHT